MYRELRVEDPGGPRRDEDDTGINYRGRRKSEPNVDKKTLVSNEYQNHTRPMYSFHHSPGPFFFSFFYSLCEFAFDERLVLDVVIFREKDVDGYSVKQRIKNYVTYGSRNKDSCSFGFVNVDKTLSCKFLIFHTCPFSLTKGT